MICWLVTVKLILHLFLIGDGKLCKVQNSAPPPELCTIFLAVRFEIFGDVDSLRGSVRRIKFEIKHHTSALVVTLCLGTTTKQSKVLYIS